jgi:hypothetical protein
MEVLAAKSLLLLPIVSWSTETAAAELSLRCLHGMLTEAHAKMHFCGDRIDDKSEANYVELRAALEKFIRDNAVDARYKYEKIEDHEKDTRQSLEREAPFNAQLCKSSNDAVIRKWFLENMSTAGTAKIRKRLETPNDPDEGECL